MEEIEDTTKGASDHDLIVELKTLMKVNIKQLQELSMKLDKTTDTKLDKSEATRLLMEAEAVHKDHESRIRNLERYVWLAIGGLAVLQFIFKFLLS